MTDMMGDNLPGNLNELLNATYDDLLQRKAELVEAANRAPLTCNDDETARRLTDFLGQIMTCVKRAEDARKTEKEPHLRASQAVDGFFRTIQKPLEDIRATLGLVVGDYQHRKQAAAKKEAEAEKERLAALAQTEEELEAAIDQEAIEKARPHELSRIQGDLATGSLRTDYDYVLQNITLVPRQFLMLNESAIKAHIKNRPQDGEPAPVSGLRFIPIHKVLIRA